MTKYLLKVLIYIKISLKEAQLIWKNTSNFLRILTKLVLISRVILLMNLVIGDYVQNYGKLGSHRYDVVNFGFDTSMRNSRKKEHSS